MQNLPDRMTSEQFRNLPKTKKNKYHNTPTEYNGRKYDSKKEAEQAKILDGLLICGKIRAWVPQVSIPINHGLSTRYVVDFMVINWDETIRWIDIKGWDKKKKEFRDTAASKSKRKSVKESYGIEIELA